MERGETFLGGRVWEKRLKIVNRALFSGSNIDCMKDSP